MKMPIMPRHRHVTDSNVDIYSLAICLLFVNEFMLQNLVNSRNETEFEDFQEF